MYNTHKKSHRNKVTFSGNEFFVTANSRKFYFISLEIESWKNPTANHLEEHTC